MARTVIAVFESVYIAKKAIWELVDSGYPRERIDLLAEQIPGLDDQPGKPEPAYSEIVMNEFRAGVSIGGGIGGSLGIIAGLLVVLGAIHLPLLAAISTGSMTPLIETAAITGVGLVIGAFTGSLFSGLLGLGIPEEELQQYAKTVRQHKVTVMVVADWDAVDGTLEVLEHYNPLELKQKTIEWQKAGERERKLAERALHVKVSEQDRPR